MVRDFEAGFRDATAEQRVLAGVAAHWPFTANVAHGARAVTLLATYVSEADALAQFFVPLDGNHSLFVPDALTYSVRTSLDPDALLTESHAR